MPLPNQHSCLVLAIFIAIYALSIQKVKEASSKLVVNFCTSGSTDDRTFCLETLSGEKASAAKDLSKLGTLIMKSGAKDGKATLNVYDEMVKKPGSPETLKALNSCVGAYKYAIRSFEMVSTELNEDPQTANYDVSLIDPEITNCVKALTDPKVQTPQLLVGNQHIRYYTAMGKQITSVLQREKKDDY